MGTDFVEDWTIVSTLGEGAFGEVQLLVNKTNGETVAMKMIDLVKHPGAAENVHKEVCIHRMLTDPHIIRYYGQRKEGTREYIFLEYAAGGELFDRIEPDVGMSEWEAQRYMHQLVSGVQYLHIKGVAHRDLKPENLLLDANDNLKITDFGMATLFRAHGKERLLDKRCGTLPYVAPEILSGPYRAQPVDVWSCGIILIAMLSGELPWDKPTLDCIEYHKFQVEKYPSISPWNKLANIALALIYSMLHQDPKSRATLDQVKKNRWMNVSFRPGGNKFTAATSQESNTPKRKFSGIHLVDKDSVDGESRVCQSQPEPQQGIADVNVAIALKSSDRDQFSFSQPVHLDDLILNTQLHLTQSPANQNHFQKLVKRMTRFFVKTDIETAIQSLCSELDKHPCKWNMHTIGLLTVTTTDRRNTQLVFKAHVLEMDEKILVDFRLSKGCGLEFKRRFVQLKEGLQDIIVKGSIANQWPVALAISTET